MSELNRAVDVARARARYDVEPASVAIRPRILSVGTAAPSSVYSQEELLERYSIVDPKVRALFLNGSIKRRHISVPARRADGSTPVESQGELLSKHKLCAVTLGRQAIEVCLARAHVRLRDVRYLCCITTTGLLTPGVSALLCAELGMRSDCVRLDIVGMGCNAGLNGLNAVTNWARANPGQLAIMLCVEICSAAYVYDGTMRSSVVNSLFGDGAGAIAVMASRDEAAGAPVVEHFRTCNIVEALHAMRYDWDDSQGKFSFFLDPEVPYVVGANVEGVVDGLLKLTGLRRSDIAHWVVHSGGKKVIDAIRVNLGLSAYQLRHTTGVLRDYGNLSSGAFLFSYERLLHEGKVASGDFGVLITMGPGSTIESALIHWT